MALFTNFWEWQMTGKNTWSNWKASSWQMTLQQLARNGLCCWVSVEQRCARQLKVCWPRPSQRRWHTMITRKLTEHFCPTPSPIMQRFKFNTCVWHLKENITQYVIRLWELTQYYDFGDTLNDMLRERLVCGVSNEQLQSRLLSEPQLTFKKVLRDLTNVWNGCKRCEGSARRTAISGTYPCHYTED